MRTGATAVAGGVEFCVWAPHASRVDVALEDGAARHPLRRALGGYFEGLCADARVGCRYWFLLDGVRRLPDPASRHQPLGVHGPSQVTDGCARRPAAPFSGRELSETVIYELHVGTFTPEGTFDAAIGQLDRLVALGVTLIELMPVAQCPGGRNWGYDGVYPFAVQDSYGGPDGLRRFSEACHVRGLGE